MYSNSPLTEVPRKLTNPLLGIKDRLGSQSKSERVWKSKAVPIGQEVNQPDLCSFGGEAWPKSTWGCLQLYYEPSSGLLLPACAFDDGPCSNPMEEVCCMWQMLSVTFHSPPSYELKSVPSPTTNRYTEGLTPWYLRVWPYLEIGALQM